MCREDAGFKGKAQDCVCRAIAIASGLPYEKIYKDLNALAQDFNSKTRKRVKGKSSARGGMHKQAVHDYILSLGATWIPTMQIGKGCQTHLRENELPKGRIIARLSRHFAAVINGVLMDTFDCSRNGSRCVYGYYQF